MATRELMPLLRWYAEDVGLGRFFFYIPSVYRLELRNVHFDAIFVLDIMAKENCTPTLWLPNPSLMASDFLISLKNDALNILHAVRTVDHKTF
jgi:hypothetical protein